MRKSLLLALAVASPCYSMPSIDSVLTAINAKYGLNQPPSINDIKILLNQSSNHLSRAVIDKVLTTLECTHEYHIGNNNILTIIDYSLPSSAKRLWVFDLKQKKLLFNTYVSHGIKSGTLFTTFFSNKNDSKASSMGVYKTAEAYYGREGTSLRLQGIDAGFNDNAMRRYIVMHGGWYMDENFIKKYGRAGRSWGCPAVPLSLSKMIINTIKDNALLVAYYPSDNWQLTSKYLRCDHFAPLQPQNNAATTMIPDNEQREDILFADLNKNNKREENEPVVVMATDSYQEIFHTKTPLNRMLRRQINAIEYIALSNAEFKQLIKNNQFNAVRFAIPSVKLVRGYYVTEMKLVFLGNLKTVRLNDGTETNYSAQFEAKPMINFKSTHQFIRWVGL